MSCACKSHSYVDDAVRCRKCMTQSRFQGDFLKNKISKTSKCFQNFVLNKFFFFSISEIVCGEKPSKFLAHDSKWSEESRVKFSLKSDINSSCYDKNRTEIRVKQGYKRDFKVYQREKYQRKLGRKKKHKAPTGKHSPHTRVPYRILEEDSPTSIDPHSTHTIKSHHTHRGPHTKLSHTHKLPHTTPDTQSTSQNSPPTHRTPP